MLEAFTPGDLQRARQDLEELTTIYEIPEEAVKKFSPLATHLSVLMLLNWRAVKIRDSKLILWDPDDLKNQVQSFFEEHGVESSFHRNMLVGAAAVLGIRELASDRSIECNYNLAYVVSENSQGISVKKPQ
ncbi:MAG: hypothetical protein HY652_10790 [Acidobacteria bacterium]|nr:hypothetical protein [Acidobacteriota bacterium]